jgi:hypothetical protein
VPPLVVNFRAREIRTVTELKDSRILPIFWAP